MAITSDIQKKILERYSSKEFLNSMFKITEAQKDELLSALWAEIFSKKRDIMTRDKKIIKHLCETKLQTLELLENQAKELKEQPDTSEYKQLTSTHKNAYNISLEQWVKKADIILSPHVFDHVISDLSKYKSWLLWEKIKHARGLKPYFQSRNWGNEQEMTKKYLALDPEKVDLTIVDFLKTGKVSPKKYSPAEEIVIKQWLLENHDLCRDILLSYDPLILPKDLGYSESSTDRIVVLKKWDTKLWYLVSENVPVRSSERHLRKYRWNEFSFNVFENKESLLIYLKNQLDFIWQQTIRFNKAIDYFTIMDSEWTNKDNIEPAYISFSTHGTYTDQIITEKLEELLSSPWKRGHKQIIESIITQARKWIDESKLKEQIMWEHYNALYTNNVF